MFSPSRLKYHLKSIISIASLSTKHFTTLKEKGRTHNIKPNSTNRIDKSGKIDETVRDSKRDAIFNTFAPSSYKYDTEEWKNASKFPVLPDYQKLVSCLYGDNADDFVNLPLNVKYAKDAESIIQTALANNDVNTAAKILIDPAALLMKVVELIKLDKSEVCKKLLLHFTSRTTDSLSSLFCWKLLRELAHSPSNSDEVTGIIYEVATENGNDIVAIYNDFSFYAIFSGGRSGYTRHFYKFEDSIGSSNNDVKVFGDLGISIIEQIRFSLTHKDGAPSVVAGAPVDESQIPALSNPKANTDILFYHDTVSCFKPETKIVELEYESSTPCRLIFLTPGGKRIIEASYSELHESPVGLNDVHKSLDSLLFCMKLIRGNDLKRNKYFPSPDKVATSKYVLNRMRLL